jgi:hypothetical protein
MNIIIINIVLLNYDPNNLYCERLRYILSNINTKYVLFVHDMNIIVDYPKENIITNVLYFIEKDDIEQVRMFVSGISNPIVDDNLLHKINSEDYTFSINTAIWKTE